MKPNVGMTDKLIRYAAGVTLISLHLSGTVTGLFGGIILAIAIGLLITGLVRFCPIYHTLGKSTHSDEPRLPGKH